MLHLKRQAALPAHGADERRELPHTDIVMEAKREEAKGKKMIYLNIGDRPSTASSPSGDRASG